MQKLQQVLIISTCARYHSGGGGVQIWKIFGTWNGSGNEETSTSFVTQVANIASYIKMVNYLLIAYLS